MMKRILKLGQIVIVPFSIEYFMNLIRSKTASRTSFTKFRVNGLSFISRAQGFIWIYRDFILLKKHLFKSERKNPIIIDVGANTGVGVIAVCKQYPSAKIWAIEADPEIADVLSKNIERHAMSENVEIINKAAWLEEGELNFLAEGHGGGSVDRSNDSGSDGLGESKGNIISVPSFDLNGWLDEFPEERIDLLKVDVEGAEYDLLEHCKAHIGRFENVIIEIHADHGDTRSIGRLISLFEDSGLFIQHIDQNTWPNVPMYGCTKDEFLYRDSFDMYFSRTV